MCLSRIAGLRNIISTPTLLAILTTLLLCCQTPRNNPPSSDLGGTLSHAVRFRIANNQLKVVEPWPGASDQYYALPTPPKRVVCTSTTMLPYLEMLGVENTLVGFPNVNFISTPAIRDRIAQGAITDLGSDANMNIELLIGLDPDLVIAFDAGTNGPQLQQIEELNIPVILCADYLESSALGRAEWVKFFGAIFDRRDRADIVFEQIRHRYDSLIAIAGQATNRPKVLSGVVYGDTWFLPGGDNWASKLFEDAGGQYLWADDPSPNWLELSFESVLAKAQQTDLWIGTATYESKEALREGDERYTLFRAYQSGQVYNYDKRLNETGGNDYFESAYARPDRVLADLIRIIHPELMPDHELYYYRQLP